MTDTSTPTVHTGPRLLIIIGGVVVAAAAIAYVVLCWHPWTDAAADQNGGATPTLTAHTATGTPLTVPGSRPAVVLFFAVECGTCGPTAQTLAQTQAQNPTRADFVAVDIAGQEPQSEVAGFLTANNAAGVANAIDTDTAWARRFNITQLSTVVIIDTTGKEVFRAVEPSAQQLQAALAKVADR
jgi:thiol-disulfide isomerase/thioredoxin